MLAFLFKITANAPVNDCMDAGGRVMQEQLPRDPRQTVKILLFFKSFKYQLLPILRHR